MQTQEQAEGKQSGLMITVICLLIMLGLIWVAVDEVTDSQAQWDHSVGEIMERDFRVAVANVMAQAQLQGRVKRVEQGGRWVEVSPQGRPLVLDATGTPDCEAIWQQVMGIELDNSSYPMTSLLIRDSGANQKAVWRCRFVNRSGGFFDYAPDVAN